MNDLLLIVDILMFGIALTYVILVVSFDLRFSNDVYIIKFLKGCLVIFVCSTFFPILSLLNQYWGVSVLNLFIPNSWGGIVNSNDLVNATSSISWGLTITGAFVLFFDLFVYERAAIKYKRNGR